MKKYIKDGVIITEGTPVTNGNKVIYNPTAEIYEALGWEEYVEPVVRTLEQAKAEKIAEIEAYDVSGSVNSFTVNGSAFWVSKADRVGLMNSTNILKTAGTSTASFWLGGTEYDIACDDLIAMLSQLELYALNCYYTTESHKASVNSLSSVSDVDAFDVTADYPQQLSFNL